MMKNILIKADGNKDIASGHIRRCLSIAEALKKKGAVVSFWFSDKESPAILKQFSGSENAFTYTMGAPAEKAEFLLLDSYSIAEDEFAGFRKYASKTGYIDDLCSIDPDVDVVINYDPAPPKDLYHAAVQLLGTQYAPLREQFAGCSFMTRPAANRIFISTGGTDPYHMIEKLLKEFYTDKHWTALSILHCDVVMGALFDDKYKAALKLLARRYPGITLNEGVQDMAALMGSCDIAITAGGTTLYELCATGVPSIAFTMADNQMEFTKSFHEHKAIYYVGDARKDNTLARDLAARLFALLPDRTMRVNLSTNARNLVDGRGAERIADAIINLK